MPPYNPRMLWDDELFRQRVAQRAASLGKTVPAMLREAGLSPNYLKEDRPRGRRLDTLAAIAHALDWTIDEITSLADERSPTGPLNFDYLAAVRVTLAVFESPLVPEDIDRRAHITARVYDLIREAGGVPDAIGLAAVAAMIRAETTR